MRGSKPTARRRGGISSALVRDEGRSGEDLRRSALQGLLADLPRRQRRWDSLVVVKLDLLTRSVKDLATLMDAFRRARVGFTAIQETVDTTSASGELFLNIIGALRSGSERRSARTRAALAHLRAKGRRVSRFAPYGYRLAPDGRLALNPKERAALAEVARLRARGLSLRAISKALAARGILARNGRPFSPSTLLGVVRNRTVANSSLRS